MDFKLSKEQREIKQAAKEFAEGEFPAVAQECDQEEKLDMALLEKARELGFVGSYIPEEYGGFGVDFFEIVLVLEQFGRGCVAIATSFAASALGAYPILLSGSDEMKQKYMPDVATGKKRAAFALTEANAGSDASGIQTTAVLDGDEWVLNGTKQWITNAGEAQIYSVVALTDKSKGARGASLFVVEDSDPGFSCGPKEKKMGIRASATCELIFKDCRIPKDRLIGRQGSGFITVMKTLDLSRPGIAILGV